MNLHIDIEPFLCATIKITISNFQLHAFMV